MGGGHSPLGHPPCIHPRAPAPSASPGNSSATRTTKPHPGPPESRPLGVGLSSETLDELFGRFPSGLEVRKLHLGPPSRPPPCTRRCSDRHHGPGPRRDTRPRSLMTLTALALRTSLLGTHGAGRCQRQYDIQRRAGTGSAVSWALAASPPSDAPPARDTAGLLWGAVPISFSLNVRKSFLLARGWQTEPQRRRHGPYFFVSHGRFKGSVNIL